MADESHTLTVEKIVPGGHGLARLDGRVVLVRGAIPGEVVKATLQRAGKGGVLFAETTEVVEQSPDRVEPVGDPRCGGRVLAHVRYARQLELKREIVRDALMRIGRFTSLPDFEVRASTLEDWRSRARLHVEGARLGFYRDGTHALCDPAESQVRSRLVEAAHGVLRALPTVLRPALESLTIGEDLTGSQVSVHLEFAVRERLGSPSMVLPDGIAGLTAGHADRRGVRWSLGDPYLREPLSSLCGRDVPGTLCHRAAAFFQANRFMVPVLAEQVLQRLPLDRTVVDLFAGVGLFGVCAAAAGAPRVWCVEGDPVSADDLRVNAAPKHETLRVASQPVEAFVDGQAPRLDAATVIVDPPRTGLPSTVTRALGASQDTRIVYVSCDAATFARDARLLAEAGFTLSDLDAFDMFPETAHVEMLGVFDR